MKSKVWTADEIKIKLLNDNAWVVRGLLAIYKFQTESEKYAQETLEHNNVGFNGADGKILSSIAEFYINRNFITEKQLYVVKKRMPKYAGQLARIANKEV